MNPVPIVFGKRTEVGSYKAMLTISGLWNATIKLETKDGSDPAEVPILLLDKQHRLLFATNVMLSLDGAVRRGEAGLGISSVLAEIHSIVLPGLSVAQTNNQVIAATDITWDTPITVNASDTSEKNTRAYEMLLTRKDNGTANANLTIASHKGPAEFLLDLSVVLFDERGQVIAAGMNNATMLVKSGIGEGKFEIPLGSIAGAEKATKAAIAVTVADVVSAPMGSRWGTFMRDRLEIPLEQLLSADDDACRLHGLQQLSGEIQLDKEFFDDQRNRDRLNERGGSRSKLLAPHVSNLANIVQRTSEGIKSFAGGKQVFRRSLRSRTDLFRK